jgi:acyl carrier protein
MDEFGGRVFGFLRTSLQIDTSGLSETSPLVTSGLLDSMALVRLVAFLERTYDVRIPDHDIRPEHFENLERMRAYLAHKRS